MRTALVVCGPTAAGKSALADAVAAGASGLLGEWVTTVLVDSMQVYREIPLVTNQARERPARLSGVVSVEDEWNVALHRDAALAVAAEVPGRLPLVLDAGTGMYLNAILMALPLAPRVPEGVRREASRRAGLPLPPPPPESPLAPGDAANPRRLARALELGMVGAEPRGSVWSAPLRFDATLLYLRPPADVLDRNVRRRSERIARDALDEARALASALDSGLLAPNRSVVDAIGVREMLLRARGEPLLLGEGEAAEEIARRTRRLARRQTRWFDKLARTLPDRQRRVVVLDDARPPAVERAMQRMRATISPR